MRMWLFSSATCFLLLTAFCLSADFDSVQATSPLILTVRTAQQFQVIDNFGASGAWSMDPIGAEWTEENKNRIADLLFSRDKGIGLSLWRFNVGAGGLWTDQLWDRWRGAECFKRSEDADYDWSRHAGQQWFLRAAKVRGVTQFLACVYSPPTWMTVNGHAHCDKNTGSTNLKPGDEGKFARFLADVLEHFAKEGMPFQYVSPVNEPVWDWQGGQEGCRYNNDDLKRVVNALHAELTVRKLKTEIDVVESGDLIFLLDDDLYREWTGSKDANAAYVHGNGRLGKGKYREYVKDFLGNPEMREKVGNKISAHSYWTDSGEQRLKRLRAMVRKNVARYAPDARYWQSEYCVMEHKRDLGMDTALRVVKVIHYDLTAAHASAWHWWLAVSPADYKDELIYTDYKTNGQQNVLPSKTLWALGNFSRYVRPGARRVALEPSEDGSGLYGSAFLDESNKTVIVVLINESATDKAVQLSFDRNVKRLTPHVTSAQHDLAPQPTAPAARPLNAPARSVVTLVCE